jgi:hypothetical protein
MLYSEVAMIHGLNNAPDDPNLAIKTGVRLCEELLEPLQDYWGRIAIRSAYRPREVNGFCNAMQRHNEAGYTSASNDVNYAGISGTASTQMNMWVRRLASSSRAFGETTKILATGVC